MNKFMMTVVAGSLLTLLGNNVFAADQATQQAIAPTNNEVLTAPTHDAPPATTDNNGNSSIADSMATDANQQPAAANPVPQTTTTTTEVKTAPNAAMTDTATPAATNPAPQTTITTETKTAPNAAMTDTVTPAATNPAPQTTITTETKTAPNAAMTDTVTPAATNSAPQTTITTETKTAPNAAMTDTATPAATNPAPHTTTTTTEIKTAPNTMQPTNDATNTAISNTTQPVAAPWNKPLDLKAINCQYVLPDTQKDFTTPELQAWASYASAASFTYDYQNYKDDFTKLQSCFTNNGWQSFHQALTKSGNLIVIDKEKLSVSAKAGEPVTVEQLQTNNNRNTWKISLPLNVVYKGLQISAQQNLQVTLRITQTKNAAGKDIIGIEQLIAAPQKIDAVNSEEPEIAPKN